MGGHYLKANRTTKMTSGKDHFFYEDDPDAILPIMDARYGIRDRNAYQKTILWKKLFVQMPVLSETLSI